MSNNYLVFKPWEELTEKEQLITTYSDFYKEVHGYRPSIRVHDSVQDLKLKLEYLNDEAKIVFDEEGKRRSEAITEFEELVDSIKATCNCDRDTAVRFIMDTEEVDGDKEYLCFKMNLPYKYFEEVI